jgi:hypothetical protein
MFIQLGSWRAGEKAGGGQLDGKRAIRSSAAPPGHAWARERSGPKPIFHDQLLGIRIRPVATCRNLIGLFAFSGLVCNDSLREDMEIPEPNARGKRFEHLEL